MGVDTRGAPEHPRADDWRRLQVASAALPCPPASAYALNATDPSGHIRKFEDMESEIIRMAIARYDGHMSEVARRLGIGRSTLYRKLKEFGLEVGTAERAHGQGRRR